MSIKLSLRCTCHSLHGLHTPHLQPTDTWHGRSLKLGTISYLSKNEKQQKYDCRIGIPCQSAGAAIISSRAKSHLFLCWWVGDRAKTGKEVRLQAPQDLAKSQRLFDGRRSYDARLESSYNSQAVVNGNSGCAAAAAAARDDQRPTDWSTLYQRCNPSRKVSRTD